ncbi:MAG: DUF1304 domain-containing protein [Parvularculaceae bacterium]|nr:DUF1304 domain-containing protein [Parvularculaceae bacterium]
MLANGMVVLVAALHFGFLALEMFFWDHPVGRELFSMTPEQSAQTAILAANQGLYNGFLGAGLLWSLSARQRAAMYFFLMCVVVAGVYGGLTAKPTILLFQAAPAVLAFALSLAFGGRGRAE